MRVTTAFWTQGSSPMSMLNAHGVMPAAASAGGSGATTAVSAGLHGMAADSLRDLGIALLVLTIIFAVAAIRGLLPRRAELAARREADRGQAGSP
jgi:hypothetical protein